MEILTKALRLPPKAQRSIVDNEVPEDLLCPIKRACRRGELHIPDVARCLLQDLQRKNLSIRMKCLCISDALFMRSQSFRESLCEQGGVRIIARSAGLIHRENPNSEPLETSELLQERVKELVEVWDLAFGKSLPELHAIARFFRESLKFAMPNVAARAQQFAADRQRREDEEMRLLLVKRDRILRDSRARLGEIELNLGRLEDCFSIIFPSLDDLIGDKGGLAAAEAAAQSNPNAVQGKGQEQLVWMLDGEEIGEVGDEGQDQEQDREEEEEEARGDDQASSMNATREQSMPPTKRLRRTLSGSLNLEDAQTKDQENDCEREPEWEDASDSDDEYEAPGPGPGPGAGMCQSTDSASDDPMKRAARALTQAPGELQIEMRVGLGVVAGVMGSAGFSLRQLDQRRGRGRAANNLSDSGSTNSTSTVEAASSSAASSSSAEAAAEANGIMAPGKDWNVVSGDGCGGAAVAAGEPEHESVLLVMRELCRYHARHALPLLSEWQSALARVTELDNGVGAGGDGVRTRVATTGGDASSTIAKASVTASVSVTASGSTSVSLGPLLRRVALLRASLRRTLQRCGEVLLSDTETVRLLVDQGEGSLLPVQAPRVGHVKA